MAVPGWASRSSLKFTAPGVYLPGWAGWRDAAAHRYFSPCGSQARGRCGVAALSSSATGTGARGQSDPCCRHAASFRVAAASAVINAEEQVPGRGPWLGRFTLFQKHCI